MFQDTRPAELDPLGGHDPWSEFRVTHPQDRVRLLRELRDGNVPVILNAPDGSSLSTSLWTVDSSQARLSFSADADAPQLPNLVDCDEAVAVAYLESVKLQFDLQGFVLVRGPGSCALQCAVPREIYRFQRRGAFRVRPQQRQGATAHVRHPALPDMPLALRVLDISIGGCALWLPPDVPPLQAGTLLGEVQIQLDSDTRFASAVMLQHIGSLSRGTEGGVRLGCEWVKLPSSAERLLQRWIDRAQQRRRLLTLG
jgi:c-di-GMP-binding flagellar brake protein YcgR